MENQPSLFLVIGLESSVDFVERFSTTVMYLHLYLNGMTWYEDVSMENQPSLLLVIGLESSVDFVE